MKRIVSAALVFICALPIVLAGCNGTSREALDLMDGYRADERAVLEYVPPDYVPWEEWTDLTGEQALEDYDYMWAMLWKNASFLWLLDDNKAYTGVDAAYLAESAYTARREIEAAGRMSRSHFAELISKGFGKLLGYGHLGVLGPEVYFLLYQSLSGIGEGVSHGFYHRYAGLLANRKSVEVYNRWREVLKEEGYTGNPAAGDGAVTVSSKEGIPYIRVSTFSYPDEAALKEACGQMADFCRDNADAGHLIIDIRGNGGGNDEAWINGFVVPLLKKHTLYTLEQMSAAGPFSTYLRGEIDGWGTQVTEERADMPEGFRYHGKSQVLYRAGSGYTGFKGRIWLLTDQAGASASDAFAAFCKDTGFATVVGTRTRGGGCASQPVALPLPNSGLFVFFEDIAGLNEDGTCNSFTGTPPDIETEEDALLKCLELIKNGG